MNSDVDLSSNYIKVTNDFIANYLIGNFDGLLPEINDQTHRLLIPFLRARQFESGDLPRKIGTLKDRVFKQIPMLNECADVGFYSLSPVIADNLIIAMNLFEMRKPILILGETGVGKELIVKVIAKRFGFLNDDKSYSKKFVAVNCSAIPRELAESQLFGYVKGAFTGAHANKYGLIHSADDGIIFFDEIQSLPTDVYPKLLRFLDSGEYNRVGYNEKSYSKANLIFASNVNLDDPEVRKIHSFPEDLYYRISHIGPINIPPLRERLSDIPYIIYKIFYDLIIKYYPPEVFEQEQEIKIFPDADLYPYGKPIISHHLLQGFMFDRWSGNGRELINILEYIWHTEHKNGILSGESYFFLRGINLFQYTYKVSSGRKSQMKDLKTDYTGYHNNTTLMVGLSVDELNNLNVKDIISRPNLLPKEVLDILGEVRTQRSIRDLKYYAQDRLNLKDLSALYCYEVEESKKGETKKERAEQIDISPMTYNKHLKRGKI